MAKGSRKNRSFEQEMVPSLDEDKGHWGVPESAIQPGAVALHRKNRGPRFESLHVEASTMFEVVLEQIINTNNLLPAWWLEEGTTRARAVCKIEASGIDYKGGRGAWSGTGFLVAEDVLCTNHHVLNSREVASRAMAQFDFAALPDGSLRAPASFRLRPDLLFWTSPVLREKGLDVTFVAVESKPGRTFGSIPLLRQAFVVDSEDRLNLVQHPDGRLKEVALRENRLDWQDHRVIQYSSDTEAGSSGAPVFTDAWELVALHHAASIVEEEGNERRPTNQGVKFSAIAAALEQHAQQPGGAEARRLLSLFRGTDELLGFFGALGRESATAKGGDGLELVTDTYRGEALDVDVGFWNVEWFNRRWRDKVDDVARVIVEMNLDVWAFSESSEPAMKALREHLTKSYGQEWEYLVSEENASEGKQITAVLWNPNTVSIRRKKWPSKVHKWFKVDSRRFEELGLEAVHGRVFNRYPALYEVQTKLSGEDAVFNLIPLHLKAKGEGSLRRRMASRLLAEAIKEVAGDEEFDADWIIGGDYNATLGSGDFDDLVDAGLAPLTAAAEGEGQLTYLKGRWRSLIDHIFVSPNLVPDQEDDFVIVALDRRLDRFLDISDHRPVLLRLSAGSGGVDVADGGDDHEPSDADVDRLIEDLRDVDQPSRPSVPYRQALARLRDRAVYYDEEADLVVRDHYWRPIADDVKREGVSTILERTHENHLRYRPKTHVYPWVDVRPNGMLKSVYSGEEATPESYIQGDEEVDRRRNSARTTMLEQGALESAQFEALIEESLPYNCEHVVPQSWYSRQEPMRGDLHHLFACNPRCNSFRSNFPYAQFDLERAMDDCGRVEQSAFEPNAGRGAVARATLYFMLRYPSRILTYYDRDAIQTLLDWHRVEPPDLWEQHRNSAIFIIQGNRNPLIDFPAWGDRLGLAD